MANRRLVCVVCGKSFTKTNKTKYCSEECRNNRSNRLPIRKCLNCGKEFGARAFGGINKRQIYCCFSCKKEYISAHNSRVTLICERCGSSFEVYPSRFKFGNPKYCSTQCAGNMPKWENERFRRLKTPKWSSIRQEILNRDGNRCTICKSKKQLIVHHISPWSKSRNDNKENLITLCRSCHHKVEYYGLPCQAPLL